MNLSLKICFKEALFSLQTVPFEEDMRYVASFMVLHILAQPLGPELFS